MLFQKTSRVLLLVTILVLALLGQTSHVEGSTEQLWRRGSRRLLASSMESWLLGPRSKKKSDTPSDPPSSEVPDDRPPVALHAKKAAYMKVTGNQKYARFAEDEHTLTGMIAAGVGKINPQTWTTPPPPPADAGMVAAALSSVGAAGKNFLAPPPVIDTHEALTSSTNCTEVKDLYLSCMQENGKDSVEGKHGKCAEVHNAHEKCKGNGGKLPEDALPVDKGDASNGGDTGSKYDGIQWPANKEPQGDTKDEKKEQKDTKKDDSKDENENEEGKENGKENNEGTKDSKPELLDAVSAAQAAAAEVSNKEAVKPN